MNIPKLVKVLKYDTETLYWVLMQELKQMGMEPKYAHDDWIYVDNEHPIMLVAHIDTISRNRNLKIRVKKDRIKARNSVLGADDRAGIYAILEILRMCQEQNVPMPSVLFTNYEEIGCVGANAFCSADVMNKNMNLFIELDRQGYNEFVYYSWMLPKPIQTYVEGYRYVEAMGSMSDVDLLTEKYMVPHLNLSVGYYNQHTVREYLIPSQLQFTIDNVMEMVKNPVTELHEVDGSGYGSYYYDGGMGNAVPFTGSYDDYMSKFEPRNKYTECDDVIPIVLDYDYYTDTITEVNYVQAEVDHDLEDITDDQYYEQYAWGY